MRFSIYAIVAAASAVSAQSSTASAPEITGNPIGVQYQATLPDKAGTTVRGVVKASSGGDGKGVAFQIEVSGLPDASLGPFMYHIHEKPVPADGNCTGAGAHLDPYKRGETPVCDATKPATCQVGDLSGKHGNITNSPADSTTFVDFYTSTDPSSNAFLGNLSFVIHSNNKTRLTCANFSLNGAESSSTVSSGYALPTVNGTHIATGTASATITVPASATTFHSGTPTQPSNPSTTSAPASGASKTVVAGAAVLAGALALVL
ncbi:Cu,Zn superoxide dismutase-like protein [Lophiostoma macrostomum CBS 122681]|uniref:superoxide dismutase n=1 Tax=Lophiostoma macrostomum CBS 122681 TaxID=1314788 RepID=A0A6A6TC07_9PLEO|nr:Cu,Zn superoxide dismutase-like protein [Lophiostoma macrostomum CBS 122681]